MESKNARRSGQAERRPVRRTDRTARRNMPSDSRRRFRSPRCRSHAGCERSARGAPRGKVRPVRFVHPVQRRSPPVPPAENQSGFPQRGAFAQVGRLTRQKRRGGRQTSPVDNAEQIPCGAQRMAEHRKLSGFRQCGTQMQALQTGAPNRFGIPSGRGNEKCLIQGSHLLVLPLQSKEKSITILCGFFSGKTTEYMVGKDKKLWYDLDRPATTVRLRRPD